MKVLIPLCLLAFATACGAPSSEQASHERAPAAGLVLRDGWTAPTPAGIDVAAGYLTISNGADHDDRLIAATSPRAERVEVHEMTMDGAVMQMRRVPELTIPAGQDVQLAPSGMHLMFFGVTEPFVEGQEIPLQLSFENAGAIDVILPVHRTGPAEHGAEHGN